MPTNSSPNMSLPIPVVGVESGPQYANDVNSCLLTLDGHTHTGAPSDGKPIPSAGLNINADLSFNVSNNLTNLRALRFSPQSATLTGISDVHQFYDVNGDIWWNNGSGVAVQITSGSSLNTSAGTNNGYTYQTSSSNVIINGSASIIHYALNTTSAPATVTLPAANSVAVGRRYIISDLNGTAATNNITINRNGSTSDTIQNLTSVTININYGAIYIESDGTSVWNIVSVIDRNAYYLQGNLLASGALTKGQFMVATATNTWGATTLSGDISESASTAGQLTVIKINGATVPASGSLTTGNVLQVNGSSALTYAPLNLAGGANYVTGSLPAGNQASQTVGSDLSGTTAAATVIAIQGNAVKSGALGSANDGYVLTWVNASSQWQALTSPALGQYPSSTVTPTINQLSLASTSSASGSAGQTMTLQPQQGQNATGASHNGGNGGDLILKAGYGGTSGSATAGKGGFIDLYAPLQIFNYVTVTANYTLDTTNYGRGGSGIDRDQLVMVNAGSNIVVTIPAASAFPGRIVMFKLIGSFNFNITPSSGNIEGAGTFSPSGASNGTIIFSNGTQWYVISNY